MRALESWADEWDGMTARGTLAPHGGLASIYMSTGKWNGARLVLQAKRLAHVKMAIRAWGFNVDGVGEWMDGSSIDGGRGADWRVKWLTVLVPDALMSRLTA